MILLNDFRRQWEHLGDRVLAAVAAAGEEGWYILGRNVAEFEEALARLWRRRFAVGVGSGLDALEISLRVLGCRAGDKVLTTPLSAFASTLAILKIGAVPVFADTDCSGHLDLGLCREVLRRREDIRFLLPVHLYGNALDTGALRELRAEFGLRVVEDCAQAVMATSAGEPAGAAGQMAATSFYPTKNLGALGDGGAILTDEEAFDRMARVLRDYGQTEKYRHDEVGYNSRLDELQAAVLNRVYLPELAGWTARRRAIARRYREGIRSSCVACLEAPRGSESAYHLFPVLVARGGKPEFMAHLRSHGMVCGEHYPVLICDQKALDGVPWEMAAPPDRARRIAESEVSLPVHPYLTDDEVDGVIDAVNGWEA